MTEKKKIIHLDILDISCPYDLLGDFIHFIFMMRNLYALL